MIKKFTIYFFVALIAIALAPSKMAYASGKIFFDPASINASNNNLISIDVKISTAIPFNASQIDLSYDTNSLEYVSYSMADSVLPTMFNFQNNSGSIKSTLFTSGGSVAVGDNQQLVTFNFKTIAESSSSVINFQPTTIALNGTQTSAYGSSEANINIASGNSTLNASPNVKPIQSAVPPKIISSNLSGFIGSNISLKLLTDKPTIATIYYGPKKALGNTATSSTFNTEHNINLGDITSTFDINTEYYYKVEVIDESGNKAGTSNIKIDLQTASVKLTIKDDNGNILPNAVVKINDKEYTANQNGQINIEGVLPGVISIYSKQPNGEFKLVGDTIIKNSDQQQLEVTPTTITNKTPINYSKYIASALIGFVAFVILVLGLAKVLKFRKKRKEERLHSANPWGGQPKIKPNQPSAPTPNVSQQTSPNNIENVVSSSVDISKAMAQEHTDNINPPTTLEPAQSQPLIQTNNQTNVPTQSIDTPLPIDNNNSSYQTKSKIIVGDAINDD